MDINKTIGEQSELLNLLLMDETELFHCAINTVCTVNGGVGGFDNYSMKMKGMINTAKYTAIIPMIFDNYVAAGFR